MMQRQRSSSSNGRRFNGVLTAAFFVASVSLAGCAGSPGVSASLGDTSPYQVAGPMVARGASSPDLSCSRNAAGFQVECRGFPQYDGP